MVSLKVDGFSHRSHVDDIEELFSKYGKVGDVYIPKVPSVFLYVYVFKFYLFIVEPSQLHFDAYFCVVGFCKGAKSMRGFVFVGAKRPPLILCPKRSS